jgi:hypothetical protein
MARVAARHRCRLAGTGRRSDQEWAARGVASGHLSRRGRSSGDAPNWGLRNAGDHPSPPRSLAQPFPAKALVRVITTRRSLVAIRMSAFAWLIIDGSRVDAAVWQSAAADSKWSRAIDQNLCDSASGTGGAACASARPCRASRTPCRLTAGFRSTWPSPPRTAAPRRPAGPCRRHPETRRKPQQRRSAAAWTSPGTAGLQRCGGQATRTQPGKKR